MSLALLLFRGGGGSAANAYTLTASAGAYTYTGVSSNLLKSKVLSSAAGSYALTGVAAGLLRAKKLTANAGAYSYTGVVAGLLKSKILPSNAGAYVLSGQNANLVYSRSYTLTASAGSYSISGVNAALNYVSSSKSYSGEVILQRKKIYIKRGKQYLIFNNVEEADSYLAAEEAIETAKKSSRGAARRKIKALKVVKPEVIQEPKLEDIKVLLDKFNVDFDLPEAQKNNDIEALIAIQSMLYALQQDEEDIELLLLAI